MIKLIASDMDGTLIKSNKISPANVEMIKKANETGIKFVIASGRAYTDIIPIMDEYGIKCACVTGNGAQYIDENGKLMSSAYLHYEDALTVIDILNQCDIRFMIYTVEGIYSIEPVENVQRAFIERAVRKKNISFEQAKADIRKHHACFRMNEVADYKTFLKDVSIIKIEAFDVDIPKIDKAKEAFKHLQTVSYLSSFPDNVEITDLKATKGKILLQAIENLNISKEEVMVLGDSYNDLSMFEIFENSVAMGNSPEDIKAAAKYVTKDYLEDGVAYAIQQWAIKD